MNKLRGILISTAILSGVVLATEGVSAKDNHLFVIQTFAQKPISEKDFNESDINSEKESALKKIQEMNLKDRASEFNERKKKIKEKKSEKRRRKRRKLNKHQLKAKLRLHRVKITPLCQPHVRVMRDYNLKLQNLKKKLSMCSE